MDRRINDKRIIGIAGVKGVGKSTWAKKALQYTPNSTRMAFADGLKDLVCKLLSITRDELESYKNKEHLISRLQYDFLSWCNIISETVGCDDCFVLAKLQSRQSFASIRELLQWLGTDVIREFDPDWHVNNIVNKIESNPATTIFIDDVRFPNEKKIIEDLGGFCLYLKRESVTSKATDTHASEVSLTEDMFNPNEVLIQEDLVDPNKCEDQDFFDIDYHFEKYTNN